ncbi:MAG: hypothetical protein HEEMFOPI_01231 [Holosporales bacterium]
MKLFIAPNGVPFDKKISQCLHLLILGKTIKEIAYELKISHRTVENKIQIVKKIFSCSSKSQIFYCLIKIPKNKNYIIDFIEKLN